MKLYDWQAETVNKVIECIKAGNRMLVAAPTGSGKSLIQLAVQEQIPGCWIVSPSMDIINGYLAKLGRPPGRKSAYCARIITPVVLRNRLLAGKMPPIKALLFDEGHHTLAQTYQDIVLMAGVPAVAFTASPYRGTPKETMKFLAFWGQPYWAITYPQAVERGIITMPDCTTVPLVDDDLITISNGDFAVQSVEKTTASRLESIVQLTESPATPTIYAWPSVEICHVAAKMAEYPVAIVTSETGEQERLQAFSDVMAGRKVLYQVKVVSEGVDLQFCRLVDASPTLSPVRWIQQFGRLTRPGGHKHYICTNRNLLRHCYLLQSCIFPQTVKQAQDAFGGPGQRMAIRAFGLESLGRLRAWPVPLASGLQASCYVVETTEKIDNTIMTVQYAAILHPTSERVLWASRRINGQSYGQWAPVDPPTDLTGFASVNAGPITDKQLQWWQRDAKRYGLDPDAKVDRRVFACLPILAALRIRLT